LEKPAVKTAGLDSLQPNEPLGSNSKDLNVDNKPQTKTTATKTATKKEELDSLHTQEPLSFESDSEIKDTVKSDNPEATENGVSPKSASSVLDKMMEVVTAVAVLFNGSSILAKLLSAKEGPLKVFSEPLDKIALLSTKAQAIGFSTKILQQAAAAILAQANQQPSLALQLLRN
jgi:flagellin-like hook-associated protein FlgL